MKMKTIIEVGKSTQKMKIFYVSRANIFLQVYVPYLKRRQKNEEDRKTKEVVGRGGRWKI